MYNSEGHSHALTWETILPTHTPTFKTLPWLLTSSFCLKCSNLARMSPSLRLSCLFPPRRRARLNPIFSWQLWVVELLLCSFFTQLVVIPLLICFHAKRSVMAFLNVLFFVCFCHVVSCQSCQTRPIEFPPVTMKLDTFSYQSPKRNHVNNITVIICIVYVMLFWVLQYNHVLPPLQEIFWYVKNKKSIYSISWFFLCFIKKLSKPRIIRLYDHHCVLY